MEPVCCTRINPRFRSHPTTACTLDKVTTTSTHTSVRSRPHLPGCELGGVLQRRAVGDTTSASARTRNRVRLSPKHTCSHVPTGTVMGKGAKHNI
jgi:hypothetical protein